MSSGSKILDLTEVRYDDSSVLSLVFALITLSPILLMPAYAALSVQTRELVIINMWAGQFLCEGFNWLLKRTIKQDRPSDSLNGYGFPSSHSQYMGFFSSFLVCHIYFRHRFPTTGFPILDRIFRMALYIMIIGWAVAVAYSRFHLNYHTLHQVFWGLGIGITFGTSFYVTTELIPARRPGSHFGRIRALLLCNPISVWLRIRDGWLVWRDGGHEEEWKRWRSELDRRSPDELLDAVLAYEPGRGTNFTGALTSTRMAMERYWIAERSPVVIFLSDGEGTVTDETIQDLCRAAVARGKALSFHAVSFCPDHSSYTLRRMAQIARQVQNSAPTDPLLPAVLSTYSTANDTIRLSETFLGIAESLRKPRGSLLRTSEIP